MMATRSNRESGGRGQEPQTTHLPTSATDVSDTNPDFAGSFDDARSQRSASTTQPEDLKDRAVRSVRELGDKAQSTARQRLEARKRDAAYTLSSVATTLLQSGNQLRDDQQALAGDYVEQAARQVERAAQYVQTVELAEIVDNVEEFARKRPAVFVGAAFALGILAARFLKSTRQPGTALTEREVPTPLTVERSVPFTPSDDRLEQPL